MFRHVEGFKAQYGDMTLMVAHEFVEWHVIVIDQPATIIHGSRQFSEEKAREHARMIANSYLADEKHGDASGLPAEPAWLPIEPGEWLTWRP